MKRKRLDIYQIIRYIFVGSMCASIEFIVTSTPRLKKINKTTITPR